MQLRLRLEACSLFAPFLVCGASGFVAPQAGASLERQPRGFRAGSLSARALQPRPASGNVLHESSSIRTFLIAQQRHACCNNRLTNAWALRMTVADGGGQNGNNGSGSPVGANTCLMHDQTVCIITAVQACVPTDAARA